MSGMSYSGLRLLIVLIAHNSLVVRCGRQRKARVLLDKSYIGRKSVWQPHLCLYAYMYGIYCIKPIFFSLNSSIIYSHVSAS